MKRQLISLALLGFASPTFAQVFTEDYLFVAKDTGATEYFAWSAALDGSRAVFGAPFDRPVTFGNQSGSAYIFKTSNWTETHKLIASDASDLDAFGMAMALDNGIVVVGAPRSDPLDDRSGSAYLFDVMTGQELHKLVPSDGEAWDQFGHAVAIAGNTVAIGAPYHMSGGVQGAVYLFDAATGAQIRKLKPTGPALCEGFGWSIAAEGNLVLVGMPLRIDELAPSRGEAYLFDLSTYQELMKFVPSDPYEPAYPNGSFGTSVALDGNTALIGAPWMAQGGQHVGAAYTFDTDTGQPLLRFEDPEGVHGDNFGSRVAIDSGRALISSFGVTQGGPWEGATFVFDAETGVQTALLRSGAPQADNFFGYNLDLQGDVALISSYKGDIPATGQWNVGTAHVFELYGSGDAFCFGDGSGATCPCAANGDVGQGCANSGAGGGAELRGAGVTSIANDSFLLAVNGVPGNKPGLILRGANTVNAGLGNPVGDGLLCTTGQTARSQIVISSQGAAVFEDFRGQPFGAHSYGAGTDTYYQYWYRDPAGTCSGAGFNFSNAWQVSWQL